MSNGTQDLLRGKVARVLNDRELVINLGVKQGVIEGMLFDIQSQDEIDIMDPDTNELLGSTGRAKVRVRVTHVQEKLAVAQTYRKYSVRTGGFAEKSPASEFFKSVARALTPATLEFTETLKRETDVYKPLPEEESKVAIGDLAIQVPTADKEQT
jgi:hypothetical protein